jgi:hypothetical protein
MSACLPSESRGHLKLLMDIVSIDTVRSPSFPVAYPIYVFTQHKKQQKLLSYIKKNIYIIFHYGDTTLHKATSVPDNNCI